MRPEEIPVDNLDETILPLFSDYENNLRPFSTIPPALFRGE